jgi:oxygen-independent coproporphyrinogen III oxidase
MEEETSAHYQEALAREIEAGSRDFRMEEFDTIYFGGGTPSLLPAKHIDDLLHACRKHFRLSSNCEISLEANPGTFSFDKARILKSIGINRISVGAQSFDNLELGMIGRRHNSDMIVECIQALCSAGFDNINLDLMLGLPLQTRDSWLKNLEQVARFSISHVSVYMLDLSDACALKPMVETGLVRIPDEDCVSDLYLETIDSLTSCGLYQYEISNFARPGFCCRHSLKYWQSEPVLGFGLASHSYDGVSRFANVPDIEEYFRAMDTGKKPVQWRETVTATQALEEKLFLNLRLTQGVNWTQLRRIYGDEGLAKYETSLQEMKARGLIEWNDSTVRLTRSGMLLSNEIFQLFV